MIVRIKKKNFIFYVGWMILIINTIVAQSYLEKYSNKIFTILGVGLLLLKIFLSHSKKEKELVWMVMLGGLGLVSAYITKDNRMLWLAIAMVAFEKQDFYVISKLTGWTMCIVSACIVGSCVFLYGNIGTSLKGGMALGMGHPNILHCMIDLIAALFIYVYWFNVKSRHILLMLIANCILYLR